MAFAKDRGGDLERLAHHRLHRERAVFDAGRDLKDRNAADQGCGATVGPGGYLARCHHRQATWWPAGHREMVGRAGREIPATAHPARSEQCPARTCTPVKIVAYAFGS